MSDDPNNFLYSSYEDWYKFCGDDIVPDLLSSKLKEIFDINSTKEESLAISYALIEIMQMKEMREECYKLVDSRIKRRFNLQFESPDIISMLKNSKIYKAAYRHLINNTTETKEKLDKLIDQDLLKVKTPSPDDSDEVKNLYKKKLKEFIKMNEELTYIK